LSDELKRKYKNGASDELMREVMKYENDQYERKREKQWLKFLSMKTAQGIMKFRKE